MSVNKDKKRTKNSNKQRPPRHPCFLSLFRFETKQNEIEAKRNKMKQIKPKQNVCACAVAKLLLKVTVFCKSRS